MSGIVHLTGLEASGGEAEVGRHRPGAFEAGGIIHCGLEGQGGNEAHTGGRHQALTDRVLMGHVAGAVIQFAKGVIQDQASVEQG